MSQSAGQPVSPAGPPLTGRLLSGERPWHGHGGLLLPPVDLRQSQSLLQHQRQHAGQARLKLSETFISEPVWLCISLGERYPEAAQGS